KNKLGLDEAKGMTEMITEGVDERDKNEQRLKIDTPFDKKTIEKIDAIIHSLLQHEPIQYVLGYTWFYGEKFITQKGVLIPRPETEELIDWIQKIPSEFQPARILDIGTGSGCIALSLKEIFPDAEVVAADVSENALKIARRNAEQLGRFVEFIELDFLDHDQWLTLGSFDLIVTNPPYIPFSEKNEMEDHVVKFEPSEALFVEGDDSLIFYKKTVHFATNHLNPGGHIFCELHYKMGKATAALFPRNDFKTIELKQDISGNLRMLHAQKNG